MQATSNKFEGKGCADLPLKYHEPAEKLSSLVARIPAAVDGSKNCTFQVMGGAAQAASSVERL